MLKKDQLSHFSSSLKLAAWLHSCVTMPGKTSDYFCSLNDSDEMLGNKVPHMAKYED